jgi:hypothetical protein
MVDPVATPALRAPGWKAVALIAIAFATVPLLVGTTVPGFAFLILAIVGLTACLAYGFRHLEPLPTWAIPALVGLGVALATVSILTGRLNGLSDEPYSTPAYASLGWSLYTEPIHLNYVQYGVPHLEESYYVYLPLLTWIQVPGLDYRWVAVAAWAGTAYRLRRDPFASGGWATPWIPLLAANGQNDFVPLLALTLALAVPPGRWGGLAEIVALGLKQFANVIVVGYHLARREYKHAALAVAVTVAFLAPFLWLDPGAVYCHAILGDPTSGCAPHSAGFFLFKRNYWLYPTWVGLVFSVPLARWARATVRRFGGRSDQ